MAALILTTGRNQENPPVFLPVSDERKFIK